MLRDVKTGDWIFTIRNGYERTVSTTSVIWPIATTKDSYARDGKVYTGNAYPSAWRYNPFDPDDKPPVEFMEGEIVMVRTPTKIITSWSWSPDCYYVGMEHDEEIRKQTARERGEE